MSEMSFEQKRQYYRLKYPRRARPYVRIEERLFSVTEVSEKGLRVLMGDLPALYRGLSLSGKLSLSGNRTIHFEGAILRFDKDEVILQLSKGPSFKNMVEEQRRIRQKYPSYFARLRQQAA
ncbi:PilZ domain-containing protein [Vibrio sp. TRT 21S02]|uniref:PilZ domain-containing protein n=1 Tax=unclassified Vibrio TaxID=2614977 RepID=UPI00349F8792